MTRSNSTSSASSSTEDAEFVSPSNFIAQYEPLPMYTEDETPYGGGLRFDVLLEEDTVKNRVIVSVYNLFCYFYFWFLFFSFLKFPNTDIFVGFIIFN